ASRSTPTGDWRRWCRARTCSASRRRSRASRVCSPFTRPRGSGFATSAGAACSPCGPCSSTCLRSSPCSSSSSPSQWRCVAPSWDPRSDATTRRSRRRAEDGSRRPAAGVNLLIVPHGRVRLLALLALLILCAASFAAAEAPPACTIEDRRAPLTAYDDFSYTVLDTIFALPPDYVPSDLVPVSSAFPGSYDGGGELQVRAVVIADLRAMLTEAELAGVRLAVQSAYRSYAYQESTFAYWVERDGYDAALASSARPGHSRSEEH